MASANPSPPLDAAAPAPTGVARRLVDTLQKLGVKKMDKSQGESIWTIFESTKRVVDATASRSDVAVQDEVTLAVIVGTKKALNGLLRSVSKDGPICVDSVTGASIAMAFAGPSATERTHIFLLKPPPREAKLGPETHKKLVDRFTLRNSKYAKAMFITPKDSGLASRAGLVTMDHSLAYVQCALDRTCIAVTKDGFQSFQGDEMLLFYIDKLDIKHDDAADGASQPLEIATGLEAAGRLHSQLVAARDKRGDEPLQKAMDRVVNIGAL